MEDQEYQQSYYEKNKETISELRKIKYHTDEKYRRKVIAKAKKYYKDKVKVKDPDDKIGYTIKVVNGVSLYTMKYALAVINKSRDFYLTWEKRGYIPQSTFTDSRGWRMFTEFQITLLDMAIQKYDSKEWDMDKVKVFLFANWNPTDE